MNYDDNSIDQIIAEVKSGVFDQPLEEQTNDEQPVQPVKKSNSKKKKKK